MITCSQHGSRYIEPPTINKLNPATGEREDANNPLSGKCRKCLEYNEAHGRGKKQPVLDTGYHSVEPEYNYAGKFDIEDFERWWNRLRADPVRTAEFLAANRRPRGVSKSQHGVAIRKAVREPMLTADPRVVHGGLIKREHHEQGKIPRGKPFKYILVKPNSTATARLARGWQSREWTVYTLKYTHGLIIVTDKGEESSVFPGWGSMKKAILDSGWSIIR